MSLERKEIISYRISRAKETLDDAKILAQNKKWNSSINRLYYAAYYSVTALLLDSEINPSSHNGVKAKFSENFILTQKIPKELGKMYSQLFSWRQKGDYDDLFDFDEDKVLPYFKPVEELLERIEILLS